MERVWFHANMRASKFYDGNIYDSDVDDNDVYDGNSCDNDLKGRGVEPRQ